MINIIIQNKLKTELKRDLKAVKEVFQITEQTDIQKYKNEFYIEVEAVRKGRKR